MKTKPIKLYVVTKKGSKVPYSIEGEPVVWVRRPAISDLEPNEVIRTATLKVGRAVK